MRFGVETGIGAWRRIAVGHGVVGIVFFHGQGLVVGTVGILKAVGAGIGGGKGVYGISQIHKGVEGFEGDVFIMLHIADDDDRDNEQKHEGDGRHHDGDKAASQRTQSVHEAGPRWAVSSRR